MATLKVIRKRIVSVKNTQKITRAMKMVAAAKLRRAQSKLLATRPYHAQLTSILAEFVGILKEKHPEFLESKNSEAPSSLVVFSSDRGLCGGFNSNLLKRVVAHLKAEDKKIELQSIGKKGRDYFKSKRVDYQEAYSPLFSDFSFEKALQMAEEILSKYKEGQASSVSLAYNGFKSIISQEIRIRTILPLQIENTEAQVVPNTLYEPSAEQLFTQLLPRYLASEIYLAHLESVTAELGARMSAMDNATSNAKEMISKLTLEYNRARQAAITKELMDIVNGAESLK